MENLSYCGKVCGKLEKLWKTFYKIIFKKTFKKHLTSPFPYDILQLQSNETLTLKQLTLKQLKTGRNENNIK